MSCVASLSLGFFVCEMGLTSPIKGKQKECVCMSPNSAPGTESGSLTKRKMLLLRFGCHCYGTSMVGCVLQGARLLPPPNPPAPRHGGSEGRRALSQAGPWAPRETAEGSQRRSAGGCCPRRGDPPENPPVPGSWPLRGENGAGCQLGAPCCK